MTRLQKYLSQKSMSLRDFGQKLGISASYAGQIARGDQLPSLQVAYDVYLATDGFVQIADWFTPPTEEDTAPRA